MLALNHLLYLKIGFIPSFLKDRLLAQKMNCLEGRNLTSLCEAVSPSSQRREGGLCGSLDETHMTEGALRVPVKLLRVPVKLPAAAWLPHAGALHQRQADMQRAERLPVCKQSCSEVSRKADAAEDPPSPAGPIHRFSQAVFRGSARQGQLLARPSGDVSQGRCCPPPCFPRVLAAVGVLPLWSREADCPFLTWQSCDVPRAGGDQASFGPAPPSSRTFSDLHLAATLFLCSGDPVSGHVWQGCYRPPGEDVCPRSPVWVPARAVLPAPWPHRGRSPSLNAMATSVKPAGPATGRFSGELGGQRWGP